VIGSPALELPQQIRSIRARTAWLAALKEGEMAATMRGCLGRLIEKAQVSALLLYSYPYEWVVIRFIWFVALIAILALAIIAPLMGWSNPHDLNWGGKPVTGIMSLGCLVVSYMIRRAATNPRSWAYWIFGFNYLLYEYWMGAVISLLFGIGALGIVIFYFEGDYFWLSLLVGVSAAALILLRPRKQDLINLAVNSRKQS
jgi:hypothetical protein